MNRATAARYWHAVTGAVALVALAGQFVLVVSGASVLVDEDPPTLAQRLVRFVSYFTVLTNLGVLLVAMTLLRDPLRDGRGWRVFRFTTLTGIVVTGLVHWFLLRPLLHLTGWSFLVDLLLHVAVPLLVLVGWLLFGPRRRVDGRTYGLALVYPVAWLLYTLVAGAVAGWYPYPFLDVDLQGTGPVAVACVLVAAGICAIAGLLWLGDRRLGPAPGTRVPR